MNKNVNAFDERSKEWDLDLAKVKRAQKVAELIRGSLGAKTELVAMEYGCGTGLLSVALAEDFNKIILADTSDGMLAVLAEKIKSQGIRNFHPQKLDLISDTRFPKQSVDVVYSLLTLHHIMETEKIFERFSEVVKPGGRIFIADLDQEDGSFHPAGTPDIHFGFTREQLQRIAESAGFREVHFSDAFEIRKKSDLGERVYPVFLMDAKKS